MLSWHPCIKGRMGALSPVATEECSWGHLKDRESQTNNLPLRGTDIDTHTYTH